MNDMVDNPDHYGGDKCLNAIRESLTSEEYRGFLRGQIMKYAWRAPYKDKYSEDLQKAQWYLNRLCEELAHQHEVYQ